MNSEDGSERTAAALEQIFHEFAQRFVIWLEDHPEAKETLEKTTSVESHNQKMIAHFNATYNSTDARGIAELSKRVGENHITNDVRISWYIISYNRMFEAYHEIQSTGLTAIPSIDDFRKAWLTDVGTTLDTYHDLLSKKHDEENIALKKSIFELDRQAKTDPLTGILNRRGIRAEIDSQSGSGAFVLLDLDDFKKVNDHHGHLVGDKILQELAQKVAAKLRRGDIVGRIGGDEFALWLPMQNSFEIDLVSNVVKRIFSTVPFQKWNIGISAGVALRPDQAMTFDDLYAKADEALYSAKSTSSFLLCMYGSHHSASLL